ncbi:MAG: YraN family protein [Verrucomicrobia bacterium]|nr:YraN family protein [Verrucomicrobiota bacterium]
MRRFSLFRLVSRLARRNPAAPAHLELGALGEKAALRALRRKGLRLLARNFRSPRGEIDLIMREGDALVFVEVKTRSSEEWSRPAAAVDSGKKRRIAMAAMDYLKALGRPPAILRFDIVEVLAENGKVTQIRHLPDAFSLPKPWRYG